MWRSNIPEVSIADVPDNGVLLDVREDDEWQAGHAPTATHLSMTSLTHRLDEVPNGSPVYVICRSGARSARVAEFLNSSGWEAVNVTGGMQAWLMAGRPVVAAGRQPGTVI